jgi:cardiolipin synthase
MATHGVSVATARHEVFEVDGHRLTLIVDGAARLDALIDLIASAERELRLFYYIFAADRSGTRVRDAAIEACRRGVVVSLLVDGFGSETSSAAFFQPLIDAGARFCRFLPRKGRRYLLRNHQKMAIADAARVLIGGFNVEDDYFADVEAQGWRDLALLVEGPAAAHLPGYFDALMDWATRPRAKMTAIARLIDRSSQADGKLRWLFGGPTRRMSPWAHALKRDIERGRRLDMIAAYFAPNPGFLRRLRRLARRGGALRIVTAAKSDNAMTIAAARHTYARLLRARARVFEYQPTRLHTKLYVIDDAVFIGSANCDMRSLFINLEVMLRIEDAGLAAAMRGFVDGEVKECREASPARLRAAAGPFTRLKWSVAYFLVAVVDYTVTRRLNFGSGSDAIAG